MEALMTTATIARKRVGTTALTATTTELSRDDRIAAAFEDGATSEAVKALIKEIEAAIEALGKIAEQADVIVRSTLYSVAQKVNARGIIEDAAKQREHLQTKLTDLSARLEELQRQDEDVQRWARYKEAEAEGSELAAEIAAVYAPFAEKMAELLPRLVENERWVEYINTQARPSGAQPLRTAEMVARGIDRNVEFPRLVRVLRLPTFEYSPHEPYVWPRSR
jgi:small-conductance mechanosensitive channel